MRLIDGKYLWLMCGLGGILILSGCGGSTTSLDSAEHRQLLESDRAQTGQVKGEAQQVIKLSLADAIDMGFKRNLDARVAALEELSQQDSITLAKIRALPGVEGSTGYVKRSNSGASSSRSVTSGQQSLEPSQSTETDRRVGSLEASWNLLDAGLALADAAKAKQEAKISSERFNKVIQNVERDVYSAYWRTLSYQEAKGKVQKLVKEIDAQVANLDRAASQKLVSADEAGEKMAMLSDRQRSLRDLYARMQLAEIELKGMLSIPMDAKLVLTTKRQDLSSDIARMLKEDVSAQEWDALKSRPEMREEILKKNMTVYDTRREVLQTLPGLNLVLSREYDSNEFLVDPNWTNFTASIVQSITGILTLPDRYRAARNKEAVADARRQALSSAIIAQVHIARERLQTANETNTSTRMAQRAATRKSHALGGKASEGMASAQDALIARSDAQVESMRAAMVYSDMQDAYAAMKATLGRNVLDMPAPLNIVVADNAKGRVQ